MFVRKNKQKLAAIAHPGPRGGKSRQKPIKMPESFLPPSQKNMHKKAAAPTLRLLKIIYFSTQPPSIGTFAP